MDLFTASDWDRYEGNGDKMAIKTLDSLNLETRCPLDTGRHHHLDLKEDSPDLGKLDLPVELWELIVKHSDIPSLTTLRRVSRRARHMVDSTFEYKQVFQRAPQIIRGALAIGAGSFTLHDAYVHLSDEACATCAKPGRFIYLITCERVCFTCLINNLRWRPLVELDVGSAALEGLPSVKSRKGHYGVPAKSTQNTWGSAHPPIAVMRTPHAPPRPMDRQFVGPWGFNPCQFLGPWGFNPFQSTFLGPYDHHPRLEWESHEPSFEFWDAKLCRWEKSGLREGQYLHHRRTPWYAGQFFVSVRVPLANREEEKQEEAAEKAFCGRHVQGMVEPLRLSCTSGPDWSNVFLL